MRAGHPTESGYPRVEVLPVSEQPRRPAQIVQATRRMPEGFSKHNRSPALQRLVDQCPPEFAEVDRLARAAARHRIAEWHALFGSLSSGICRLLLRAAEADADAQYFRVRAEAENSDALRAMADRRMTTSRQSELMAWELACRETDRRPKGGPGQTAVLDAELSEGLTDAPGRPVVNGRAHQVVGGGDPNGLAGPASAPPGGSNAGALATPTAPLADAVSKRKRTTRKIATRPAPERHADELSDQAPTSGLSGPKTPGEPE